MTRFSGTERRLLVFLSVATFFDGYDFLALSQLLPNLRTTFGLSPATGGQLVSFITIGTILAYIPIRWADRVGRRPALQVTILGYATCALFSGLAPNAWLFAIFQLIGRVFLIAEWSLAMVYAAETFSAERRGLVIGIIQAATTLGAVTCAGLTPVFLKTALGWRAVYLAGVLPLVLLAWARRGLPETPRFLREGPRTGALKGLLTIWRSPWRRRVIQVALIWFFTYLCTQNVVVFWKEFALAERGLSDAQVGSAITFASVLSLPPAFFAGKLLDAWGRRAGGVFIYVVLITGVLGAYQLHSPAFLTVALTLAIFGLSAQQTVLNAITTELFPTGMRADAFGWANTLLGRTGAVISPALVGLAAERVGWGAAVSGTVVFALVALVLILLWVPETRGLDLEATAAA